MHARTVITLRVILEDQLPVGAHVILNPPGRAEARQIPVAKLPGQRREDLVQRWRLLRQTNEDKAFPQLQPYGMQRIISLIEAGDGIHVRCPNQSAVKRIGPGVIWTLDRRAMPARLLAQPRPSVAANIVKSTHCALLIAHHDEALTRHLLNEVIPRPGELALVPHAHPVPGKDLRLFLRENFWRNKVTLRQRPRARGKAFGRLAEDRLLESQAASAMLACRLGARQRLLQTSFAVSPCNRAGTNCRAGAPPADRCQRLAPSKRDACPTSSHCIASPPMAHPHASRSG